MPGDRPPIFLLQIRVFNTTLLQLMVSRLYHGNTTFYTKPYMYIIKNIAFTTIVVFRNVYRLVNRDRIRAVPMRTVHFHFKISILPTRTINAYYQCVRNNNNWLFIRIQRILQMSDTITRSRCPTRTLIYFTTNRKTLNRERVIMYIVVLHFTFTIVSYYNIFLIIHIRCVSRRFESFSDAFSALYIIIIT